MRINTWRLTWTYYVPNHAKFTIAFPDTFAVAFFQKRVTVAHRCSQLKKQNHEYISTIF